MIQSKNAVINNYVNIHKWLKLHYGSATMCLFCGINTGKRFHWALRHTHEYEKKIDNYIQLCPSCHKMYDVIDPMPQNVKDKISKSMRGRPIGLGKVLSCSHRKAISEGMPKKMTQKNVIESIKMIENGYSLRKVGRFFNLPHATISKYIKKEQSKL